MIIKTLTPVATDVAPSLLKLVDVLSVSYRCVLSPVDIYRRY